MAELAAIAGQSGSGKSTSIKHLDPKTTFVLNVSGKALPFKGSGKLYNSDNKNYAEPTSILDALERIKGIAKGMPHITEIILDDSNYLQTFNMMGKALETGYTKFSILARDVVTLIQESKKLRSDLIIYYVSHIDAVEDGEDIVNYKLKTIGKMLDNQVVLEGLFTVILYANVECKGDDCKYQYLTNRYGKYLAKSPSGMFPDLKIDNNLATVSKLIREYYN